MSWDGPASASAVEAGMFFFGARGKILILLWLRRAYLSWRVQNLGSKGLAGKILVNKELATQIGFALCASESGRVWAHDSNAPLSICSVKVETPSKVIPSKFAEADVMASVASSSIVVLEIEMVACGPLGRVETKWTLIGLETRGDTPPHRIRAYRSPETSTVALL